MKRSLSLVMMMAACSGDPSSVSDGPTEVAGFSSEQRPLDLLLVIDDSAGMAAKQRLLAAHLPSLIESLGDVDLHVGVISSDMGTANANGAPGPAIGTVGAAGCAGTGKAGKLLVAPTTAGVMQARYLAVPRNAAPNFTGTLADVLGQQVQLGETGCGFEQPLAAMRAALRDPDNTGFVRDDANLAVVVVTDEDDCSARTASLFSPTSSSMGPLDSFRCFRFGVTCDPDDPLTPGDKQTCRPREDSSFVDDIASFHDVLLATKNGDGRRVMFATIAAPADTVAVELRTSPNAAGPTQQLAHACAFTSTGNQLFADPPVRLAALVDAFGTNGTAGSLCSEDLTPATAQIGATAHRLAGDHCLARAVPAGAECHVFEAPEALPAQRTELAACDANGGAAPCFRLVDDAACSEGQRLEVTRATAATNTWTSMECSL